MSTWRKVGCCLVAAVAAFGVPDARAGEFLDALATNENRVVSSPVAAGGDIILKLSSNGVDDYIHVFTNAAVDAGLQFVPAANIYDARLLLVGGGGSGGAGWVGNAGGGGAGGFIEKADFTFVPGRVYDVTVGAGGAAISGNNPNVVHNGADTAFAGLTAFGGGGGGSCSDDAANGGDGGSGGGGGGWDKGGAGNGGNPVEGQGYDGSNGKMGSGGGAGGSATTVQAGNGKPSDILGESVMFAGGGGGSKGAGGAGGGGSGGNAVGVSGVAGEDGLGGGGGGCNWQNSGAASSGRGGSGIVIVRYQTAAGVNPVISFPALTYPKSTRMRLSGRILYGGEDASKVSATLEYWVRDADPSTKTAVTLFSDESVGTRYESTVSGLSPETAYVGKILLSNDAGASCEGHEVAFATPSMSIGASVSDLDASKYVKLTDVDGIDEVFVFTNNATFHVAHRGYARILVVGGGGGGYGRQDGGAAGAGGGGGGAGGYVYRENVLLEPGDYPIVVGAGGAGGSGSWMSNGQCGGDSSFDDIVACGGGGGAGPTTATANTRKADGGSGAGGNAGYKSHYSDSSNGYGIGVAGQGNRGGSTNASKGGCGGGGAGGVGGKSVTVAGAVTAGSGGAGLANSITGENLFYAGGGGGATYGGLPGAGGSGVGGDGADGTAKGKNGMDGRGGGGGGGADPGNTGSGRGGGRGGCGTVIVRYTDFTKVTDSPKIIVTLSSVTTTSADFDLGVVSLGDADSVAVTAEVGYDAEHLGAPVLIDAACRESATYTITGLSPGRSYVVRVTADNGLGGDEARSVASFAVTTAQSLSTEPPTVAHTSYSYAFGTSVSAVGAGENVVNLYVQDENGDFRLRGTQAVTEPGEIVFPYDFSYAAYAEKTVRYYCELVNTDGGRAWTNVTPQTATTILDDATYTWTGLGADNRWSTPGNWTSTATGATPGYPTGRAKVVFPTVAAGIDICVDTSATYSGDLFLVNTSKFFRLGGDGTDTLTWIGSGSSALAVPAAASNVLDGVSWKGSYGYWTQFNAKGSFLHLTNGARFDLTAFGSDFFGNEVTILIEKGSSFKFTSTDVFKAGAGLGSRIVLDNGECSIKNFSMNYNAASNDLQLVIRGTNSQFTTSVSAGGVTGGVVFDPGYPLVRPPVRTGTFPGGGKIPLSMQQGRRSLLRGKSGNLDLTLVETTDHVNVANLVFGAVQKEGDYFFLEDAAGNRYMPGDEIPSNVKVTKVRYHHKSAAGAVLFVR